MKHPSLACRLIIASALLLAPLAAAAQAAQKPVTMKIGHVLTESDNVHQALLRFKEAVGKRTQGAVTVTIHSGSSLGSLRQMFESIGLGTQEAGMFDAGTPANSDPAIGVLELPYIFDNLDHVHRVVDGALGRQIFDGTRAKTGIRTIASYDTTFRKTFSKRAINGLADLKGMKVRVPEVPAYIETFKLLGASPTPVPWGDLYTSLSTGVVEGFENKAEAAFGSRLHEQAKFAAYTGHIFVVNLLMVNDRWFNSLTPETQKALLESAKETEQWQRARALQSEVEFEDKMKTAGVQFTKPDTAAFRKAVAPIYTSYGTRHNLAPLIEKVRNER
jgi:TRAP-type transport system periplasmic protein